MFKHWLMATTLIFAIVARNSVGIAYGVTGPLEGVLILAGPSTQGGTGSSFAITDGSGYYSMTTGLTAGTYNLTAFANGYILNAIGPVTVVAGQTTAGVNFVLQVSGGISGKVTDATSGNPINGTSILASPSRGPANFGWIGTTGSDGSYLMATNLPTGTYNVSVFSPTGYIGKMTTVSVTAGVETKNVDLQLARSGIISGKVSTPNGTGLFGIAVNAFTSGGTSYGSDETDLSGNFRIVTGLRTGTYTVYATGAGNSTAYGGLLTPTPVSVTAGQETSNINIQLTPNTTPPTPSGTISGRITDMSSNPISFAEVTASFGATQVTAGFGATDNDGYYVISGLSAGNDYNVSAKSSGHYDASYPTLVSVTAGQTTPNIDIQMVAKPAQNFGTITGTVTGDTTVIPEFPYPLVEMLSLTLVTTLAAKLTLKARRHSNKDYSE